jgi:hypothetical protein
VGDLDHEMLWSNIILNFLLSSVLACRFTEDCWHRVASRKQQLASVWWTFGPYLSARIKPTSSLFMEEIQQYSWNYRLCWTEHKHRC